MAKKARQESDSSDEDPMQLAILDKRQLGGELHYLVAWDKVGDLELDPTWMLANQVDDRLIKNYLSKRRSSSGRKPTSAVKPTRTPSSPGSKTPVAASKRSKSKTSSSTPAQQSSDGETAAQSKAVQPSLGPDSAKEQTKRPHRASVIVQRGSSDSDLSDPPARKKRRIQESSQTQPQASNADAPPESLPWPHPTQESSPVAPALLQPVQPDPELFDYPPPSPLFQGVGSPGPPGPEDVVIYDSQPSPNQELFDQESDSLPLSLPDQQAQDDPELGPVAGPSTLVLKPVPRMPVSAFHMLQATPPVSVPPATDQTSPIGRFSSPTQAVLPLFAPSPSREPANLPPTPPRSPSSRLPSRRRPSNADNGAANQDAIPQDHVVNAQSLLTPPPEMLPVHAPSPDPDESSQLEAAASETNEEGPIGSQLHPQASEHRAASPSPPNTIPFKDAQDLVKLPLAPSTKERVFDLIQSSDHLRAETKRNLAFFLVRARFSQHLSAAAQTSDTFCYRLAHTRGGPANQFLVIVLFPHSSSYALGLCPAQALAPETEVKVAEPANKVGHGLPSPRAAEEDLKESDASPIGQPNVKASTGPVNLTGSPTYNSYVQEAGNPEQDGRIEETSTTPVAPPIVSPEPQTKDTSTQPAAPADAAADHSAVIANDIKEPDQVQQSTTQSHDDILLRAYTNASAVALARDEEIKRLKKENQELERELRTAQELAKNAARIFKTFESNLVESYRKQLQYKEVRILHLQEQLKYVKAPEMAQRAARASELEEQVSRLQQQLRGQKEETNSWKSQYETLLQDTQARPGSTQALTPNRVKSLKCMWQKDESGQTVCGERLDSADHLRFHLLEHSGML